MRYIIVRDGTIPIVLARVLHSDPPAPLDDAYLQFEHLSGEVDSFELPDDTAFVGWWWANSDSGYCGFKDFKSAYSWLSEPDDDGEVVIDEVGPGHLNAVEHEGTDDESYAHLFDVRGHA